MNVYNHGSLLTRDRYERREILYKFSTERQTYRELGTPGARDLVPPTILTPLEKMLRFPPHNHSTSRRHYYKSIQHTPPPFWSLFFIYFVLWLMIFVCLYLVKLLMCLTVFFSLGIVLDLCFTHSCYLLQGIVFFGLVTHTHRHILTHPLCNDFALTRIASHWIVGECWMMLVGRRSETPPTKVTYIVVTQVKKKKCWLFFYFFHNPVWELRTSAATPSSLFSVASTTNLVGHNTFISFIDRHKNANFQSTSIATEQIGVQCRQLQ